MADDETTTSKVYQADIPQRSEPFFLKGSNHLDWGLKNRLANIFNPVDERSANLWRRP